ncbi:PREDICTED: leucine-rich repeat transmembrane protein FLRT1-like [Branchiostoma belcheri]|uniref:Leucine-rich repeat transmembrane protein FLRT1-like n=1 Tax=Branchiostoma belcheri TaxID=7741 RepID=A0A6P4ZMM4_BRABE|nr:PREDICTED: leucine-rich repeat transmembrane protein FLRT1-like [Branchiostoma belcheri]
MKRFLVLLLIILKEARPTAAHSCSCSSDFCWCGNRVLTSVPQDLPTDITTLYVTHNSITTLNQSDFSSTDTGTFNTTPQLRELLLQNNIRWRQLSHLMRLVGAPGRQV